MLDKLAPEWRHLIIILVPVLIAWVTQEIPNWNLPVSISALIGVVASALLLWFTGVTKQYGLFKETSSE
jgi:MFS superfamily sulfate permease-like transporter